ncbi:kinase [Alteromonas sp.]|jgi:D-glycerate 3-kinase|nr:kinase [Alteromonas sp.]
MDIHGFLKTHKLPSAYAETAQHWFIPLCERVLAHQEDANKPFVVSINGCQGSGKSTLTSFMGAYLSSEHEKSVVSLSIDDFYLSRSERRALAIKVHPLLQTRGVPGTHNVSLALDTMNALNEPGNVALPRFEKALDDPLPHEQWPVVTSPPDIIILEGWCVGLPPQKDDALARSVNSLEKDEDPLSVWRRFVNTELGGSYQTLFDLADYTIMLKAPSFDCVYKWRLEQEHKLAESAGTTGNNVMSDDDIARFIAHYQRLTEHALQHLPARCDTVFSLDTNRQIINQENK